MPLDEPCRSEPDQPSSGTRSGKQPHSHWKSLALHRHLEPSFKAVFPLIIRSTKTLMNRFLTPRRLATLAALALATAATQASVFIVEPTTGSGGSAPGSDLSSTFTPSSESPPLNTAPVPEPSEYAAVIGLALGAFAVVRRGRTASKQVG